MKDYSEVTAGLTANITAMNHALNDKKYWDALDLINSLSADFDKLKEFVINKIEVTDE